MKRRLHQIDPKAGFDDIEDVGENGACTCSYQQEFGGLPCRHAIRAVIDGLIKADTLMTQVLPFWLTADDCTDKLNPEFAKH